MKLRYILLSVLLFSNHQIKAQKAQELSDYLKNYSLHKPESVIITITNSEIDIDENRCLTIQSYEEGCESNFYIGNIKEINQPSKISNYLKNNGFRIDFVSEKRDQNGNLYAYINYEATYWILLFNCGSLGCGVSFKPLDYY